MRDRYETGLATITDMLRAEDADRGSRTKAKVNVGQSPCAFLFAGEHAVNTMKRLRSRCFEPPPN